MASDLFRIEQPFLLFFRPLPLGDVAVYDRHPIFGRISRGFIPGVSRAKILFKVTRSLFAHSALAFVVKLSAYRFGKDFPDIPAQQLMRHFVEEESARLVDKNANPVAIHRQKAIRNAAQHPAHTAFRFLNIAGQVRKGRGDHQKENVADNLLRALQKLINGLSEKIVGNHNREECSEQTVLKLPEPGAHHHSAKEKHERYGVNSGSEYPAKEEGHSNGSKSYAVSLGARKFSRSQGKDDRCHDPRPSYRFFLT